jgi:hypothetical protein
VRPARRRRGGGAGGAAGALVAASAAPAPPRRSAAEYELLAEQGLKRRRRAEGPEPPAADGVPLDLPSLLAAALPRALSALQAPPPPPGGGPGGSGASGAGAPPRVPFKLLLASGWRDSGAPALAPPAFQRPFAGWLRHKLALGVNLPLPGARAAPLDPPPPGPPGPGRGGVRGGVAYELPGCGAEVLALVELQGAIGGRRAALGLEVVDAPAAGLLAAAGDGGGGGMDGSEGGGLAGELEGVFSGASAVLLLAPGPAPREVAAAGARLAALLERLPDGARVPVGVLTCSGGRAPGWGRPAVLLLRLPGCWPAHRPSHRTQPLPQPRPPSSTAGPETLPALEAALDAALTPAARSRVACARAASVFGGGEPGGAHAADAAAGALSGLLDFLASNAPDAPPLAPAPLRRWLEGALRADAPGLAAAGGGGGAAVVQRWVDAFNERLAQLAGMVDAGTRPPAAPPPHLAPGFGPAAAGARLELLRRMALPPVGALLVGAPPGLGAAEVARLYLHALQHGGGGGGGAAGAAAPEAAAVAVPAPAAAGGDAAVAGAAMGQLWGLLAERLEAAGAVLLPADQAAALASAAAPPPRTLPAAAPPRPSYSAVVAGGGRGGAAPGALASAPPYAGPGAGLETPLPLVGGYRASTPAAGAAWQPAAPASAPRPAAAAAAAFGGADPLAALLARARGGAGGAAAGAGASARLRDAEASVVAAKQLLSSVALQLSQGSRR